MAWLRCWLVLTTCAKAGVPARPLTAESASGAVTVAAEEELMAFLSSVVRGNVMDQFGLEPTLADRLRAAENLMKRYAVGDDKETNALTKLDKLLEGIGNAAQR